LLISISLLSSLSHALCFLKTFSIVSSIFSCLFSIRSTLWAIVHHMFDILLWLLIITLVNSIQISWRKSILIIIPRCFSIISKNSIWILSNHLSMLPVKVINLVIEVWLLDFFLSWAIEESLVSISLSQPNWFKLNSACIIDQTSYGKSWCFFHFVYFDKN